MKKLIKLFFSMLVIAMVVIPTAIIASADETRVFDDANLFSSQEISTLENNISSLKSEFSHDFVIVTTDDADGKSSQDYADDYFDYNGFGVGSDYSGFLLLIDMDNREIYISTCGSSIDYLTDTRRENTLDVLYNNISEDEYYETDDNYDTGNPSNQYGAEKNILTTKEIFIAILIALVIVLIFIGNVVYKYGFVGPQCNYPLKQNSKLNLTVNEDIFISKSISQVRLQSSSSGSEGGGRGSSGRTSTHTSSSGRTHGGGGRRF